ncbi:hypothetical protein MN0502_29720 [Arthrobacter sp. MN05-02]|nr:hypothetical protein MN0502_29720 [Arthrobacter sp. MN05-02]
MRHERDDMAGDAGELRYTLTDDGAFLRLRWAAGVTIGGDDVRSTTAAVTAASPDGRRPLLVNIGLVDAITAEARHLLIEDDCSCRTGVVGVDEVGRVLTAFNYRSVTPEPVLHGRGGGDRLVDRRGLRR